MTIMKHQIRCGHFPIRCLDNAADRIARDVLITAPDTGHRRRGDVDTLREVSAFDAMLAEIAVEVHGA